MSPSNPGQLARELLQCTPMSYLFELNGGKVPSSAADWERVFGNFFSLRADIAFSDSLARTDLTHLRRIYAAPHYRGVKVNEPALAGEVFVAHGLDGESGEPVTEFITKSRRGDSYLFGTIRHAEHDRIVLEPSAKCTACHRAEAPLMTAYPWSNSTGNPAVFFAMIDRLAQERPAEFAAVKAESDRIRKEARRAGSREAQARAFLQLVRSSRVLADARLDGVPLVRNNFMSFFDERHDPMRDTQYYHFNDVGMLHESVEQAREALLLHQLLAHAAGDRERQRRGVRAIVVNAITDSPPYYRESLNLATLSDFMHDFSVWDEDILFVPAHFKTEVYDVDHPSGDRKVFGGNSIDMVDRLLEGGMQDAELRRILAYDEKRRALQARGLDPLPAENSPRSLSMLRVVGRSNLPSALAPIDPGEILTVAITESDRDFLYGEIAKAARALGERPEKLMADVVASPSMERLYARGYVPSRAQTKAAFLDGLKEKAREAYVVPRQSEYLSSWEQRCLTTRPLPKLQLASSCVRCHGSESPIVRRLAGDSSIGGWDEKIVERVSKAKTMPPTGVPEAEEMSGAARAELGL